MNKIFLMGKIQNLTQIQTEQISIKTTVIEIMTGDNLENSQVFSILAFDKMSEQVLKYLKTGDYIVVEGKLKSKVWEQKDNTKLYYNNIVLFSYQKINNLQ